MGPFAPLALLSSAAAVLRLECRITCLVLHSNLGAGVILQVVALASRLVAAPQSVHHTWLLAIRVLVVAVGQQYCWDIVNQLVSVEEDRVNKPYRPITAGLVSVSGAYRRWGLSWCLFGWISRTLSGGSGLLFFVLSQAWVFLCYVHPGWNHWFARNAFPAGWTYLTFRLLDATVCSRWPQLHTAPKFDLILALWDLATVHLQEFHDVDGDRKINRRTLPVILSGPGRRLLRQTTAATIVLLGCAVVRWGWKLASHCHTAGMCVGLLISGILHVAGAVVVGIRCAREDPSKEEDERTYKVYYVLTAYCAMFFLSFLNTSEGTQS
ncbi:hypothetical protein BO70DRAFT_301959 [Aspergillus heteromorphus CBS 117.55]|uniref:Uncharacterized protein n=1 Tax=Aspergillus heteromorphus CBS 117.55 TaxID=1448321 RepID=A0A317UYJ2_9EURO|nr:uncharacterized protein BO70DRAFT_301959 [Aspergillus heteromorphus CBS 117.55]PWY66008.1 hypothetical protein BO70DRAFT_301959 [Aspergillus heteromorphus CBS 117.55]